MFTDGACSGNPGPGGWAFILQHPATGAQREGSGAQRHTTNNRMEMTAVIEGLRALERPSAVTLFSDSQYVVNGLNEWLDDWKANGWKRGKKRAAVVNIDLWELLDNLRQVHELDVRWVRGHNEHPENERCDRLAVAAIKNLG